MGDAGDFLDIGNRILKTERCDCKECDEYKKKAKANEDEFKFARAFALAPLLIRFRAVAENWRPEQLREELVKEKLLEGKDGSYSA